MFSSRESLNYMSFTFLKRFILVLKSSKASLCFSVNGNLFHTRNTEFVQK